ncbi:MAG: prepilin-type N-terminal cleavage/methylation domain-containing protein [Candidatus Marinimicrobia bacterium]|nr:prepilin-type N-terminal cleavage/methylation domain-containing protein [Candidatus Neomarinimicrobiota bacterium]MBT3502370.1 prepilin-type N-terminal cleavage/methylation domain-containing protein [Candidatus Neomarinimicrobiota bacterium]MBT3839344.1 prepilin-type N-terminal cleavage/methylation domain-containing protein [Candidatus Neomarinimicrobiota bacterium]MBT4000416.1 prepilin-type N-terminal cleavage/methylation domain-containing protein [Candidatus Neomarinimicrobiota bacterium]M
MIKYILKQASKGMTLVELSASIVVMSVIAFGMTSGAQAVMLHYQTDTVRTDIRHYGNSIIREITRELNLAQKIEIDGHNGFSRLKLYDTFTDISPELYISCHKNNGIEFDSDIPLNGVLKFPSEGAFRGNDERTVYVKDFLVEYEKDTRPTLSLFKSSYVHLTLTIAMEMDVNPGERDIEEEHTFHRTVFLGTSYIQTKVTDSMSEDDEV